MLVHLKYSPRAWFAVCAQHRLWLRREGKGRGGMLGRVCAATVFCTFFLCCLLGWRKFNLITGILLFEVGGDDPINGVGSKRLTQKRADPVYSQPAGNKTVYNVRRLACILRLSSLNNQVSLTTKKRSAVSWFFTWGPLRILVFNFLWSLGSKYLTSSMD